MLMSVVAHKKIYLCGEPKYTTFVNRQHWCLEDRLWPDQTEMRQGAAPLSLNKILYSFYYSSKYQEFPLLLLYT